MRRSEARGGRRGGRARPAGQAGYVTAETAVVIPSLVVLVAMLLWGVAAVSVGLRCGDAARAGARAAARGEPPAVVAEVAEAAAPAGARVRVERDERDEELFRVRVEARTPGPGALAVSVAREAVARGEPA